MADENVAPSSPPTPHGVVPPVNMTAPPPPAAPEPAPAPARSRLPKPIAAVVEFFWPATTPHIHQTEWVREVVETIVFVVVLVLLLKSFAAEAFVIPTGSMAETLWGYQKVVQCPECGHIFPVNCSQEVESGFKEDERVTGCTCPNCRLTIKDINKHSLSRPYGSGDRVLVAKSLWESGLMNPARYDVTVFKFPGDRDFPRSGPEKNLVAMNYIKRMIGLPTETIGIYRGNLYSLADWDPKVAEAALQEQLKKFENDPDRALEVETIKHRLKQFEQVLADLKDRPQHEHWQPPYMFEDLALTLPSKTRAPAQVEPPLLSPGFGILRKPAAKILAVKRIVFDNDLQPKDLKAKRWAPVKQGEWVPENDGTAFKSVPSGEGLAWLQYTNLIRDRGNETQVHPELVTDFMGYNSGITRFRETANGQNWVGELIIEAEVTVDTPQGSLVLELGQGVDRFRAVFDLATGECKLRRVSAESAAEDANKPEAEKGRQLGETRQTALKGRGTHHVRFANVDEQLVVWVDGALPFRIGSADGVAYDPPKERGPTREDFEPARIGVSSGGAVSVQKLKLYRDTYYTQHPASGDTAPSDSDDRSPTPDFSQPNTWSRLSRLPAKSLYVQPGHYLCLGDNSPHSSDGRTWGLVPERLLLGRALLVYYPFYAPFWPLEAPVNRVGPIR